MNEFSWRTRNNNLERMRQEHFDLLIIGGGITGAGVALDAASRGLKCALVEKRDFAAGTSSRSTKLIHGGLRYLEHFDFKLVRESLRERATLLKNAPHLVKSSPFLIPIYRDLKRNYDRPLKIRMGLWLYDLLAGHYRIDNHKRISREETLALAPQINADGLTGGLLYYDAITDDSRLVIEVIKAAHKYNATIANYTRVVELLKDDNGKINRARLRDEITGREFAARASVVINAAGVWLDEVRHSDRSDVRRIRPSKGIHLVISGKRLKTNATLLIPSVGAHRFYFVVPWKEHVLIGTTDTDYKGDLNAPSANVDEVREILSAINSYFPGLDLTSTDVIATFAGLRPLLANNDSKATTDISRGDEVIESKDGLISIAGGKLTTYRHMAVRAVDQAALRLGDSITKSKTSEIALNNDLPADADSLSVETIHAVNYEMAMTVADVLARRTRLALLEGAHSLDLAFEVADVMTEKLGWSETEKQRQLDLYKDEFNLEYRNPTER